MIGRDIMYLLLLNGANANAQIDTTLFTPLHFVTYCKRGDVLDKINMIFAFNGLDSILKLDDSRNTPESYIKRNRHWFDSGIFKLFYQARHHRVEKKKWFKEFIS